MIAEEFVEMLRVVEADGVGDLLDGHFRGDEQVFRGRELFLVDVFFDRDAVAAEEELRDIVAVVAGGVPKPRRP